MTTYNLPDPQDQQPADYCPECGGELWEGEITYQVEGPAVCLDCYKSHVKTLLDTSPTFLAGWLGIHYQTVRKETK